MKGWFYRIQMGWNYFIKDLEIRSKGVLLNSALKYYIYNNIWDLT